MPIKNTHLEYGSVSKWFHWLLGIFIIIMVSTGFFMGDIANRETMIFAYTMHKLSGLMILSLMIARLLWALSNPKPNLPASIPSWEQKAGRIMQKAFYLALILMPLSGWIMSTAAGRPPGYYGLFSIPMPGIPESEVIAARANRMHGVLAWALVVMIALHIAAAIKHHFIYKNDVLRKMLPNSG